MNHLFFYTICLRQAHVHAHTHVKRTCIYTLVCIRMNAHTFIYRNIMEKVWCAEVVSVLGKTLETSKQETWAWSWMCSSNQWTVPSTKRITVSVKRWTFRTWRQLDMSKKIPRTNNQWYGWMHTVIKCINRELKNRCSVITVQRSSKKLSCYWASVFESERCCVHMVHFQHVFKCQHYKNKWHKNT